MSDGNYLNKVRKSESGNKDTAVNPMGGASGRYQFVKSTWEGLGYNWKDRFNPQLQEEAMAKYTSQTRKHFVDSFKSEPSDADLYGMHFLGSGTYIKALKKGDNALITDVVSKKAYDYNKNVMSRNGKPITVGDLKQWLGSKMGNTTSAAPLKPLEYENLTSDIDTKLPQGAGITFSEKEETKTEGEKAAALLNEENFLEDYAAIQAQQQEQQQSYQQQPMVAASEVIPIEYVAQTLPQEFQDGGEIPVSSNGVYDYPMQKVIVPTNNGHITMKDVNYPILGIDEFGNKQMMQPNKDYKFKGKTILEIPQFKK